MLQLKFQKYTHCVPTALQFIHYVYYNKIRSPEFIILTPEVESTLFSFN
jgi:hypothetical protein